MHLPIGFEKDINGVVDLVDMKAYTYKEFTDKEFTVGEIPANMLEKAKEVGSGLATKALAKKITKAVFDRGGFIYTGSVKAVAEGAREGGLKF